MKLKRLLSAIIAGAMVLSTMSISEAKELSVDSFFQLHTGGHLSFDSVDFYGDGYNSGYAVFHLVKENTSVSFNKGSVTLRNEIHPEGGFIKSENQTGAKATFTDTTLNLTDVGLASVYLPIEIKNSTVTAAGTDSAKMGNAFNRSALTVDNSTLEITGCNGRGITLENGNLTITGNSSVTVFGCSEANIAVSGDKKITVSENASLVAESIVTKDTVTDASSAVEAAAGATVNVGAPVKIGDTSYATLSAALDAATEGATIKLEKGTYSVNGNKISTKGITLEGTVGTVINAVAPIKITAENVSSSSAEAEAVVTFAKEAN